MIKGRAFFRVVFFLAILMTALASLSWGQCSGTTTTQTCTLTGLAVTAATNGKATTYPLQANPAGLAGSTKMNPNYLWTVADHLWQSTLFAGVVGLLTLALRENRARRLSLVPSSVGAISTERYRVTSAEHRRVFVKSTERGGRMLKAYLYLPLVLIPGAVASDEQLPELRIQIIAGGSTAQEYSGSIESIQDHRPTIFTALQEKLGIKLDPRKAPVDLLIIDHAERVPTEN